LLKNPVVLLLNFKSNSFVGVAKLKNVTKLLLIYEKIVTQQSIKAGVSISQHTGEGVIFWILTY
jgi:hypothetical protein